MIDVINFNIYPMDCTWELGHVSVTSTKNEMNSVQSPFFSDTAVTMLSQDIVNKQKRSKSL